MVSSDEQRRDYPRYNLDEVCRLAGQGKINYAILKVEYNVQDLDYTLDEVCLCLRSLRPDDFKESILYPDADKWLDVYLVDLRGPTGDIDKLYVKLRVARGAINIHLHSFHLEGRS